MTSHASTTVADPGFKKKRFKFVYDEQGLPCNNEKYVKVICSSQIMHDLFEALNVIDIEDQNR